MKVFLSFLIMLAIVPSSLAGMVYGWGIEPQHWGWIAQSYIIAIILPTFIAFIPD